MSNNLNFFERVYKVVKKIPKGYVTTYGRIAFLIGSPRAARQVGYAMRAVKSSHKLPCHRVVNRFGELAPEYVFGDKLYQKEMLEREGVTFQPDGRINMEKHFWDGNI